jgi:cellulose synthase/poly-beta-1,6-N-acetylglucosamine synthase-like glycosyltransferase
MERTRLHHARPIVEGVTYLVSVWYLMFGSMLYHVCRLGFLKRLGSHRAASRAELEAIYEAESVPALAVLVPSYREEEHVVRQTLLSAALMEYPDRRVVLLIDDPPEPADPIAAAALQCMRELPAEIQALVDTEERKYVAELAGFEQRVRRHPLDHAAEIRRVSNLYRAVARWLEDLAAGWDVRDHTDRLFAARILREPAARHRAHADAIRSSESVSERDLRREYTRLAALFTVRLTSFERKRVVNLSHAPNKAMNLNSYLALIGRSLREVRRPDGFYLEECDPSVAHVRVPRAEYVITVDADSLLLHDYALRLAHVMERPDGRRFGVVQTPYTAVPDTPINLERAAGAQTDLQWIIGQGMTYFGATFWIGASALLRYRALQDICQIEYERGHAIKKYIQDRTLTEDSDSTIDLVAAGWQLYNYPDRLSYSATPPDFGALVIQRRRWANGSLLILPKLFRYLLKNRGDIRRLPEAILRTQYLASTALGTLVAIVLLLYPFESVLTSRWLPYAAIPYYVLYGRDLVLSNYRWRDLVHVYALTLMLIPVNLGGVAKSLHQWWTGRPPVFARTPKVTGRTAAPALYIVASFAVPVWTAAVGSSWLYHGQIGRAMFSCATLLVFLYGPLYFIGVRALCEDLAANLGIGAHRARAEQTKPRAQVGTPQRDRREPIVDAALCGEPVVDGEHRAAIRRDLIETVEGS